MKVLPDVTSEIMAETPSPLQWVGMENIAVPILMRLQDETTQIIPASADVYVSLEKPKVKGIHMSRLYSVLNQLAELECKKETLAQLLEVMIQSQQGLGHEAKIKLTFDLLLRKSALLSNESGFQHYPVSISAEKNKQGFLCVLEVSISYSSTCPCSASLAQSLYADEIDKVFSSSAIDKAALLEWVQSPSGSVATPHSQRSYATIRITLGDNDWPDLASLIFQLEDVIGTPVQTAVKRRDEQEFARLNAANLMFCEDAARRIKNFLEEMTFAKNYWFKVEHQESLHAHNAVVIDHNMETKSNRI